MKSNPCPVKERPDAAAPAWFWITRDRDSPFVSIWRAGECPTARCDGYWRDSAKHPRDFPLLQAAEIFARLFGWELLPGECRRVEIVARDLG
jgi:hypothetical protein